MTTTTTEANSATLDEFWGEPISIYTREQAIEDGVLVDVSDWAGSGANGMMGGVCVPVAMTRSLWNLVDLDADDQAPWRRLARQRGESTRGRAHDLLWMARLTAARNGGTDRMGFGVLMTTAGKGGRLVRRHLLLEARIDSDGLTIGLPEDC